ncbi:AraC family transcriptional regulator [Mangrovicoccus sp. HB161399]|uniref:AraC family transcriptional regulator n=1 Tax=Mangrovicoccus sp. HB161399 TaxID=2720392 RepID=UPI00155720FB|nr:AraC family transcriptional regulator [Mangrovicoccus sp. HB161399]
MIAAGAGTGDFTVPADWVRSAIQVSGAGPNLLARVLAAAGLEEADIEGEDAAIGQRQEALFFHAFAEQMGNPYFAAELGLRMPGRTSTIVSYVFHGSRSLGDAMAATARLLRLTRPGLQMDFSREGETGRWILRSIDPWVLQLAAYQEFAVSSVIADFRNATGTALVPDAVQLPSAARGHEARLARLWGCPVDTGGERLVLTFGAAALALPLRRHDPDLLKHLQRYGELLLRDAPEPEEGLLHRVESAVLEHLPEGGAPPVALIAEDLGLSVRTLTRRLAEEGQGYRELVEDVRRRKAQLMLSDRTLSLAEIAFLLGYSEQSSFTNAFRRWTGRAPGAYRSDLLR